MQLKTLSAKQKKMFLNAAQRGNHPKLLFSGAIRTGKSKFSCWGFVEYALSHYGDGEMYTFAVLGNSWMSIEENIWGYLLEYLDMRGIKYNSIKQKITIGKHIKIIAYGASNAVSFKSFQGATIKGCLIDEAAILDSYALEVAEQRMITYKEDSKLIHCTNPEGSTASPYYTSYIMSDEYEYTQFTLLDNPLFNEDDIEHFRKIYDEVTFSRKVMGEWVVASGAVYKVLPDEMSEETLLNMEFQYINVGVDEGRIDAISAIYTGFKDGVYYPLAQFYYKKDNADIMEARDLLRADINKQSVKWRYKTMDIYFETTPGFLYNLFVNDVSGLNLNIGIHKVSKHKEDHRSASAVQERIDVTNFLIKNKMLKPNRKLKRLREAFANATYDENKGVRRDDGSSDIDTIDSFEYSIKPDIGFIVRNMNDLENIKLRREYA